MAPFSYDNKQEKTGVEPCPPGKLYIGWQFPVPDIHHDFLSFFFSTIINEVFCLFHEQGS
jgi:hypothetical protein